MSAILEVACFSPEDAVVAAEAGAQRIELCRDYEVGGLTPSLDDLAFVKEHVDIPVFVMIREQAGDFNYSSQELRKMASSAHDLLEIGADGIVFGALTREGQVDEDAVGMMIEAAAPYPVTFHRAFDEAPDPFQALDALVRCGVSRLLTSAGQPTALEGAGSIAQLCRRAGTDLVVIPGGGIRSHNAKEIAEKTGAFEIHSAARTKEAKVDPQEVHRLVKAIA